MKKIINSFICFVLFITPALSPAQEYEDFEHRVNVNEILDISVYQEPDLNKAVMVASDGTINYPLLGSVSVEGLTTKEVEEKLTRLLRKDYIVNPQVTVLVKEYAKVYVLGQVNKPGAYEIKAGLTVVGAIALAGGLTQIAAPNGVKVIRTRNRKETIIPVPVGAILKGASRSGDVKVEPNDTIVVPESFF